MLHPRNTEDGELEIIALLDQASTAISKEEIISIIEQAHILPGYIISAAMQPDTLRGWQEAVRVEARKMRYIIHRRLHPPTEQELKAERKARRNRCIGAGRLLR